MMMEVGHNRFSKVYFGGTTNEDGPTSVREADGRPLRLRDSRVHMSTLVDNTSQVLPLFGDATG
jgi:hypothetical protein